MTSSVTAATSAVTPRYRQEALSLVVLYTTSVELYFRLQRSVPAACITDLSVKLPPRCIRRCCTRYDVGVVRIHHEVRYFTAYDLPLSTTCLNVFFIPSSFLHTVINSFSVSLSFSFQIAVSYITIGVTTPKTTTVTCTP